MDQVIPWMRLLALIEPYCPKARGGGPPLGLANLLRIYFVQQLSDPAAEEALYDSETLRRLSASSRARSDRMKPASAAFVTCCRKIGCPIRYSVRARRRVD